MPTHVHTYYFRYSLPQAEVLGGMPPGQLRTAVIFSCHPACPIHTLWASRSLLEYLYAHID